jgi:hypothetical protein
MIDMHSFGKDEMPVEPERESIFRPDSPILDGLDSGADLGQTIVSQKAAGKAAQLTTVQQAAAESDEISATLEVSESHSSAAPDAAPEAPDAPAEIFKFDPTLTFASANSSELPAGNNPDNPSLPELIDTNAVSPSVDKAPQSYAAPAPIELELPSLPNRDAVITAATEAARLAFSELNTLPHSGTPETAEKPAESSRKQPASAQSPAAPVENSPSPEMIESVVNRLLQQMQPQIMEVVNREVLRPAIEAIVRREMKKS